MADTLPVQPTPVTSADVANAKLLNETVSGIIDNASSSSTAVIAALNSIAAHITSDLIGGTTGVNANRILTSKGTGGFALQASVATLDGSGNLSGIGNITGVGNIIFATGKAIQTSTSAGNTLLLQAYDVDGAAYTTFATLTANNTPTLDFSTSITIGGVPIYTNVPQNSQSTAYTTVLADAQKHILHPTSDNNARTFTIDSNANVAYPVGTAITFVNQINTVTIAITSDTLTLAGAGTTGSRTLAANGIATALKIASTSWIISGVGLS